MLLFVLPVDEIPNTKDERARRHITFNHCLLQQELPSAVAYTVYGVGTAQSSICLGTYLFYASMCMPLRMRIQPLPYLFKGIARLTLR